MTYKDLITLFYVFAAQHPILKTASWGDLSDYSRDTYITKYPAIHIVPQPSTLDNTYTNFNFTILFYDLLSEWVGDEMKSNQLDSLSLCHEILNDFYAYFTNQLTGYGFFLQNPVQFSPFADRFQESVVGVEAQITIVAEQSACLPPFIPPPSPSPTTSPTPTPTITQGLSPTPTETPTNTPTETPTLTPTETPTNTPTETPTNTPTLTPTSSEVITNYLLAETGEILQAENNDLIEYD